AVLGRLGISGWAVSLAPAVAPVEMAAVEIAEPPVVTTPDASEPSAPVSMPAQPEFAGAGRGPFAFDVPDEVGQSFPRGEVVQPSPEPAAQEVAEAPESPPVAAEAVPIESPLDRRPIIALVAGLWLAVITGALMLLCRAWFSLRALRQGAAPVDQ